MISAYTTNLDVILKTSSVNEVMVEMYMAYSYSKQKMVRPGAVQENRDAITGGNR
jgi:hypothetical protein